MSDTSSAAPLSPGLNARLSAMMFLQYAIWGAWLPLLWPFLAGHRGFDESQISTMFAVGAVGAILAPFIAGQIADRWFATEKFLALSHLVGALLVWQLASLESFTGFLVFSLAYSLIYSPTLPLTNSLAFHHLPDRDRDFGRVRVWGTVGWIVVGIGIGHWLKANHTITHDQAVESAIEALVLDDEARAAALERTRVERNGMPAIDGVLVEQSEAGGVVLRVPRGTGDEGEREFDVLEPIPTAFVKAVVPYVNSLAAEGRGEELRDAMLLLEGDPSDETKAEVRAQLTEADLFSKAAIDGRVGAGHKAGMADAFRLSAVLGLLMGLYCLSLPRTPPSKGSEKNATFEAVGEIRRNPLLTLFLLAVPISCIHQFYFVHTAGFLGSFQSDLAGSINALFGVGGGGLMTVGQMSELFVLAAIPFVAKKLSRKSLLMIGVLAYALRMAIFAYVDSLPIVIVGVALHGVCFGCFIFVAFMVVDEETTADVRASAQSLFNLVIIGIGIIVGSFVAGEVAAEAKNAWGDLDYTYLFSVPMWASFACLGVLLVFYPGGRKQVAGDH